MATSGTLWRIWSLYWELKPRERRRSSCASDGDQKCARPLRVFPREGWYVLDRPWQPPSPGLLLHSPLAGGRRDAQGAGPRQLFAGCPERAYFGNNTARCAVASSAPARAAAAVAPARAARLPPQPGELPGGRGPGGVGSHLLGEVGGGVALCVGAGEGFGLRAFGVTMRLWGAAV